MKHRLFSVGKYNGIVGITVVRVCRLGEPEQSELEKQSVETERADRSMFVQELLLSTLAESLRLDDQDSLTLSVSSESDSETQSIDNDTGASEGADISSGSGGNGGGAGGGTGAANVGVAGGTGASVNVDVAERPVVSAAANFTPNSLPMSNAVAGRNTPRNSAAAKPPAHRNMVKPLREGTKNTEKEPPPNTHLARH